MYQTSLSFKDVAIDKKELKKRLGGDIPGGLLGDREEKLRRSLNPVYAVRDSEVEVTGDGVELDFGHIDSKNLAVNLKGCSRAHVVCLSLGHEADRLLRRAGLMSVSEQFIVDAMLSAYVESCLDYLQAELYGNEKQRPRFAPGYGDFDICLQENILDFLDAAKIGVSVNESMLLIPTKTITAIIGVIDNYEQNT